MKKHPFRWSKSKPVATSLNRSHPQLGAGDIPTPMDTSTPEATSVLPKWTPAPWGTMHHHDHGHPGAEISSAMKAANAM